MQEHIAKLVHPVVDYGLSLRRRLAGGEVPELETEQAVLRDLLLSESESRRWMDFGGESAHASTRETVGNAAQDRFLGIRYALVCWLDELFTDNSDWGRRWNEAKLEVDLYGSNDRAWKFWEQARLAQARPGADALEVFYLCVMLGFRGQLRNQADALATWVKTARMRLGKVPEPGWTTVSDLDLPTYVPPLTGAHRVEQMLLVGWIVMLAVVPVVAFLLIQRLAQT